MINFTNNQLNIKQKFAWQNRKQSKQKSHYKQMRRRPKSVGEKCNSIIEKGLITYTQGTHMHMHN